MFQVHLRTHSEHSLHRCNFRFNTDVEIASNTDVVVEAKVKKNDDLGVAADIVPHARIIQML